MQTAAPTLQVAPWSLSSWTDAAQLMALIDPDSIEDEARGATPSQWFATLRTQGKTLDAVIFLAHALPRYECVVWATRSLIEGGVLDRSDPFVTATLRWIDDPCDRLRRAAGELADLSGKTRAGELLCNAVFYSGGSIAPDDLPPVPAPAEMCARMAGGAVLSGAYQFQKDADAVIEDALRIGAAMASQPR